MGDRAAVQELQAPTVPPQNLDAEESVLGAMMLSPGAIAAVSEVLEENGREFYRESHAKIYRAALALYAKGEPVDAITLVDELDERGELPPEEEIEPAAEGETADPAAGDAVSENETPETAPAEAERPAAEPE